MPGGTASLAGLRNRTMMLIIGGALLVLFIWFVAYFSPSGKKLGAVNTQTQTALTQQAQLNDQLARLRTYSNETGTLIQLSDRLSAALPPTTDIYNHIPSLSQAATTAGVSIESVSPNTPTADGGVSVIGVSINTRGSYDQTLAFIKALNAL